MTNTMGTVTPVELTAIILQNNLPMRVTTNIICELRTRKWPALYIFSRHAIVII